MADMKMSAPNGVKVYNVAGGKSLPEWLSEKKREALRKDEQFRRRVELIQARGHAPGGCRCVACCACGRDVPYGKSTRDVWAAC
jgi:hypothetical protein